MNGPGDFPTGEIIDRIGVFVVIAGSLLWLLHMLDKLLHPGPLWPGI